MESPARSCNTQLVARAVRAASSHNTQPWRFRLEDARITILPDRSRRCPAVDPDDHHLFASLGCAAENLSLAAQALGFDGQVRFDEPAGVIRVDLAPCAPVVSALEGAIEQRQCSRSVYDGTPLTRDALRALEAAGRGDGVRMLVLEGRDALEQVLAYVAAGNDAQYADRAWRSELIAWLRFNTRSARATGDGLHVAAMGSPDVPDWLGRAFMRFGSSARGQTRKDSHHIRSSAAVAIFVSEVDDARHWVEAGRCYQRFALQATALGLSTAFLNPPVEVPALRSQFSTYLGIGAQRPDLVVRVGRGPRMPQSLRRPVEDVIVD